MKIVINKTYGCFGLSTTAIKRYRELSDNPSFTERNDPILVQVVEELGEISWADYSRLKIVEIPDDVQWTIEDYDGIESVHEVHRVWR